MNKKPVTERKSRTGRPTSEESRLLDRQVVEQALQLFLRDGYDVVSMEAVAKTAKISKRTLYARYDDKKALFLDALRWSMHDWVLSHPRSIDFQKATLETALLDAAHALLEQALNPTYIKLGRIMAAKADIFREDASYKYDMSLSPRVVILRTILEAYGGEIDDKYLQNPDMTAELFLGLIAGIPARLASFGNVRSASYEKARVQLAVDLFVKSIRKENAPRRRRSAPPR